VTNDPMRPAQSEPTTPAPIAPPTPQSSPTRPARRKNSGALVNIALAVAVAVAIGGVAFAVGRSTAPASASGQPRFGNGLGSGFGNGQFPTGSGAPDFGGQGGFGRGGRTITGTVESVTAETLTIKTAAGQTVELALGPDTTYSTKAAATAADVTTGTTVEVQMVFGAGGGQGNSAPAASGPIGTAGGVTVVP
jgi:hypothetical protein